MAISKESAQHVVSAFRRSRVGRTLERYQEANGNLVAGGIAYTGLFSVFAALAVGVSVLMALVGGHDAIRRGVVSTIDSLLPGVLDTGDGGLVTIDQLVLDSPLNPGTVIATLTMLFSAMSLMGAIRTGVRAMFDLSRHSAGLVRTQVMNLLGLLVVGAGVLLTALASVLTVAVSGETGEALGLPAALTSTGTRVAVVVVSFLIDGGVLTLVFLLCGARPPRRELVRGSALGALVFGVLREVGTGILGSAAGNPMLASFAAVVVLLLWLNLSARVVLVVAAWTADPEPTAGPDPEPTTGPGSQASA